MPSIDIIHVTGQREATLPAGERGATSARTLGKPDITRGDRRITYDWLVKEDDENGTVRRHLACLTVRHERARSNVFSGTRHGNRYVATLGRETETPASYGGVMRGFRLFSALGICSEEAGRFSAKQFERFASEALEILREHYAMGNERVLPYFDPNAEERS
jgi:hypothetical protein